MDLLKQLKKSEYGKALEKAYDSLDRTILYDSHVHGLGHIERTMLLCALICQGEEHDENITKMALLGCSYHDIGRIDDRLDFYHGTRSADKLSSDYVGYLDGLNEDDKNIIYAAISAHSDRDINISSYENKYGVINHEKFIKVVQTLKDADNLDRVRIGDLDPSHLRQKTSKNLVETAQWIFDNMQNIAKEYISDV